MNEIQETATALLPMRVSA